MILKPKRLSFTYQPTALLPDLARTFLTSWSSRLLFLDHTQKLTEKEFNKFCRDLKSKDGRAYTCKSCRSNYRKSYNKRAKSQISKYNKQYRLDNLEHIKSYKRNRRDAQREACKKWSRQNPHKVNELAARKRARRKEQTPKWANIKAIREFYKNCPEGYHVDHIVPVKGETVSGLHVLANLQYLPASENIRKGNRF